MDSSKILLVDDEQEILNLLKITLKKEGFLNIDEACCANHAIKKCWEKEFDLIILDVLLPDGNGLEVCKKLREITTAPILFLTAKTSDLDKLAGFAMGADDYITKPFNPLEVAARIKAHLKRQQRVSCGRQSTEKCIYYFERFTINEQSGQLIVAGKEIECPAREFQLLLFLCKYPNRLYSRGQLYEQVWGEEAINDDNTVMVHIRRIREKIEEYPSNPKILLTVRGLGYKLSKS
ncbi:MAG: response regulator transcription factor [Clostridium sp.]|uniref:response regulator transcription factor n=1 Tax=Clostridium sp. TaxID=1506 RepID=UPI003D6D6C28